MYIGALQMPMMMMMMMMMMMSSAVTAVKIVSHTHVNPCSHLPTFVADRNYCRGQKRLSVKTRRWRMGVADLYNACSDWSTVKECRPTIRRDVSDKCRRRFCVGDKV